MEYYPVDLYGLCAEAPEGKLAELQLRPIVNDVLQALEFIHSLHYAHRDVKATNVMLKSGRGPACLIDYGFAMQVQPVSRTWARAGTPGYMAPEIFQRSDDGWEEERRDGRAADVFAVGCMAHNLVSAVRLFGDGSPEDTLSRNKRGIFTLDGLPQMLSTGFKSLLISMLEYDPGFRPSAEEALASLWFSLEPDALQQMAEPGNDLLRELQEWGREGKVAPRETPRDVRSGYPEDLVRRRGEDAIFVDAPMAKVDWDELPEIGGASEAVRKGSLPDTRGLQPSTAPQLGRQFQPRRRYMDFWTGAPTISNLSPFANSRSTHDYSHTSIRSTPVPAKPKPDTGALIDFDDDEMMDTN
jgi:serine/threonine protein kinase